MPALTFPPRQATEDGMRRYLLAAVALLFVIKPAQALDMTSFRGNYSFHIELIDVFSTFADGGYHYNGAIRLLHGGKITGVATVDPPLPSDPTLPPNPTYTIKLRGKVHVTPNGAVMIIRSGDGAVFRCNYKHYASMSSYYVSSQKSNNGAYTSTEDFITEKF